MLTKSVQLMETVAAKSNRISFSFVFVLFSQLYKKSLECSVIIELHYHSRRVSRQLVQLKQSHVKSCQGLMIGLVTGIGYIQYQCGSNYFSSLAYDYVGQAEF